MRFPPSRGSRASATPPRRCTSSLRSCALDALSSAGLPSPGLGAPQGSYDPRPGTQAACRGPFGDRDRPGTWWRGNASLGPDGVVDPARRRPGASRSPSVGRARTTHRSGQGARVFGLADGLYLLMPVMAELGLAPSSRRLVIRTRGCCRPSMRSVPTYCSNARDEAA